MIYIFKIGDKVTRKFTNKYEIGTVVFIDDDDNTIGVDFGEDFYGHDLNGILKDETGWYVPSSALQLAKNTNKESY